MPRRNMPGAGSQLCDGTERESGAYSDFGGRQNTNVVAVVPGTWNRPVWSRAGEVGENQDDFCVLALRARRGC